MLICSILDRPSPVAGLPVTYFRDTNTGLVGPVYEVKLILRNCRSPGCKNSVLGNNRNNNANKEFVSGKLKLKQNASVLIRFFDCKGRILC